MVFAISSFLADAFNFFVFVKQAFGRNDDDECL